MAVGAGRAPLDFIGLGKSREVGSAVAGSGGPSLSSGVSHTQREELDGTKWVECLSAQRSRILASKRPNLRVGDPALAKPTAHGKGFGVEVGQLGR